MKKIVVLTGAGISAESGLKTFRDSNGLWENHKIEDVATPQAWKANPEIVLEFYNQRRLQASKAQPNDAHLSLVVLEKYFNVTIVTQNVDDLHERAGCTDVVHMHGQLRTLRCESSHEREVRMESNDLSDEFVYCKCCIHQERMRPDIVWFGEIPMEMQRIREAVTGCDLFVVVGSSGHVYPAAGLVNQAKRSGAHTVLVNLEEPANADVFDEVHLGPAGKLLPTLVSNWLKEFN